LREASNSKYVGEGKISAHVAMKFLVYAELRRLADS
jgi:hypothetical protein